MRQIEQLLSAWPLLGMAFLLAVGLTIGAAVAVHAGSRMRLEWMWAFFVGVPLSMVVGVIIRGRSLGTEMFGADMPDTEDYIGTNWGSRIITLVCLAIAMERILRFIVTLEFRRARGLTLLGAFLTYFVVVNIVCNFFGTQSRLSHQLLYAPIFTLAVFAYAQNNLEQMLRVVRGVMLIFLLVSLAFLAVKLPMVAETNYRNSLIPGAKLRFYGFATHPNTLAPLCFMLMCCIFLRPFRHRWLTGLAWAVAWVCLLLTQSKTSIALVVVIMGILHFNRGAVATRALGASASRPSAQSQITWTILAASLLGIALLVAVLVEPRVVERLSQVGSNQQVISFSGRTPIWNETLKAVQQNPIFGYGPGLWGVEFRLKTGMLFVTHAHNQYLQTLGAAGFLGLAALVLFLGALLYQGWRTRVASGGVTLALGLFLVVRGMTEVPLQVGTAMQSEFLLLMFLLALSVGCMPARARVPGSRAPATAMPPLATAPRASDLAPSG